MLRTVRKTRVAGRGWWRVVVNRSTVQADDAAGASPAGLTGSAPPLASHGDGGAGTTLADGAVARSCGSPTPPSAKASTAAPPHNAATVLPLGIPMASECSYSAQEVQKRYAHETLCDSPPLS